jgi:hypothetical protein
LSQTKFAAAASAAYIISQHVCERKGFHGLGDTEKTVASASIFGRTMRLFFQRDSWNNLQNSCIIIIAADYNASPTA